jgi:hypothetical protein
MCRAHNTLLAERDFGRAFMKSKLAQARLRKREATNERVPELKIDHISESDLIARN